MQILWRYHPFYETANVVIETVLRHPTEYLHLRAVKTVANIKARTNFRRINFAIDQRLVNTSAMSSATSRLEISSIPAMLYLSLIFVSD